MAELDVKLVADRICPTAHDDLLSREFGPRHAGEILQILPVDAQCDAAGKIQPYRARRLVHAFYLTAQHAVTGSEVVQRSSGHRLMVGERPQAAAGRAGAPFRRGVTGGVPYIGRHDQQGRKSLLQQPSRHAAAVGKKGVSETAAVNVTGFGVIPQSARGRGTQALTQGIARGASERLIGRAISAELGRIETDEAHMAAVMEADGIAVVDVVDRYLGINAVDAAFGGGDASAVQDQDETKEAAQRGKTRKGALAGRPCAVIRHRRTIIFSE